MTRLAGALALLAAACTTTHATRHVVSAPAAPAAAATSASEPAQAAPQASPAQPAPPTAAPAEVAAPEPEMDGGEGDAAAPPPLVWPSVHQGVEDFAWPDPLPASSADAQALNKGLYAGSWTPDPAQGFDQQWLDEAALRDAGTRQRVSRRSWIGFTSGDDRVPMDTLLADRDGPAVGYVFSLLTRALGTDPNDRPAVLHVRHRGRVRAWWDGRQVVDARPGPGGEWVEERVPVVLTGPYDVLLLKLGRGSAQLGPSMDVTVRVSTLDGGPVPDQKWQSMRLPGLASDLQPGS